MTTTVRHARTIERDDEQDAKSSRRASAEPLNDALSALTIVHAPAEGTVLDGTSRGDGSAEVVKPLGWRWGRTLGTWYLPRTRDVPPKRAVIDATATALRAAGYDVTVDIDATTVDPAAALAAQAERDAGRADRMTNRATRLRQTADHHDEARRAISDHIPIGQPILAGHHSQARHERAIERMTAHDRKSLEAERAAAEAEHAARNAEIADGARHAPVTVANRIERLTADLGRAERALAAYGAKHPSGDPDGWALTTRERIAHTRAQLEHWQAVRAHQVATGQVPDVGPHTVKVGDFVRVSRWYRVAKVNRKTVALDVEPGMGNKVPWHKVTAHRPADTTDPTAVDGTPQ